jgi:glutamyl-tRNA synthetase
MNQPAVKRVRTRFAPSPTGYMHIGGMRTALFNWLFARHHGGDFILRIDDTDQQRNMQEALGPILQAFRWLGLNWDEGPEVGGPYGPYFQSQRNDLYQTACEKLLASGHAYRDFDPPELIQQDRMEADKEKRQYITIRRSLDLTAAQIDEYVQSDKPHVIRLLVPRDQLIVIDDHVRGRVEFEAKLIPDPVIMRGNGTPLYNFATVVDDAQLQISHIIRAEEHLSNTPIQVLIYQALGEPLPEFAHIPYVAAPGSKEKLSKRKLDQYRKNPQFKKLFDQGDYIFGLMGMSEQKGLDPVMVEYYEKIGYLPAGVLNSLARLGWSLDDKTEYFSKQELIDNFTLERVIKSAAGFDPEKLQSYQSHWMNQLSLEEKVAGCTPYAQFLGSALTGDGLTARITEVLSEMKERLVIFSDLLKYREFFVGDQQLTYDAANIEKFKTKDGGVEILEQIITASEALIATLPEVSTTVPLDPPVEKQYAEGLTMKLIQEKGLPKKVVPSLVRYAFTAKLDGLGLESIVKLLGLKACHQRLLALKAAMQ